LNRQQKCKSVQSGKAENDDLDCNSRRSVAEDEMGLFDNALKGAVPGGDLTTPIAIAAGALLLGKLFGGGSTAASAAPPAPSPAAPAPPTQQGGGLLGGLSDLVHKFENGGQSQTINSWIGQGQNAAIPPGQLGAVLGQQTISDLARKSGMSEQELLAQLANVLPKIVNSLTPNGRLPTPTELER
jgi:uncharacterized protein YidB (DUF937 family)